MVRKNRFIPHYSEDELAALQLDGIRWTIAHALAGGPQYRAKLGDIRPEDIRTLDDVQKLPFTTTDDLREGYPLPLLSVPRAGRGARARLVRHHGQTENSGLHPQGHRHLRPADGPLF